MLTIFFLTGAALFGAGVTRRALRGVLSGAEQVLCGLAVGWALSTTFVYGLAKWQGRLSHSQIVWTSVIVWLAASLLFLPVILRYFHRSHPAGIWRAEYTGLSFVVLVFAPIFYRLFSSHMLSTSAAGVSSGGSSSADMSFHAALASSFAYGENFPAIYTPLPPAPLLYPFLPDFQTAVLMAAGARIHVALLLTAVPLALATTGLAYSFAVRIARSQRVAVLATILFLLNGGLGFIYFIGDWRGSSQSLLQFWSALSVNYANLWSRGIHWTNIIADTLLPQRTSLFGLPMGLMVSTLFVVVWRC